MSAPRLERRVDNLEYRMESIERKHEELLREIRPLKDAIAGMGFIQKAAAFLTVVASLAVGVSHWIHR